LTLDYASQERFLDFFRAALHGFQEEIPESAIEHERRFHEPDRFYGYRVGERWVSTFGAFTRKMVVPGGAWVPTAAVSLVTVTAPYRRRGLLTRMMHRQFADSRKRGEPLAALWASEAVIYGRYGYGSAAPRLRMTGSTRSMTFRPEVDLGGGSVDEVSREQFLALAPAVHDAVAAGRPGTLDRSALWWEFAVRDPEHSRGGATAVRHLLHYDASGAVTGFGTYRFKAGQDIHGPTGEVQIGRIEGIDPRAYARLWRYVLDLDLARTFVYRIAALDEPVQYLVADPRAIAAELTDALHVRVVDVQQALEARRYASAIDVAIEVVDPQVDRNSATFRLTGGPDGAQVRRSRRRADVTIGIRDLGAIYLGGTTIAALHAAGVVAEHRSGAVARASGALRWEPTPFSADVF
jgi:predicted acetyltransferase